MCFTTIFRLILFVRTKMTLSIKHTMVSFVVVSNDVKYQVTLDIDDNMYLCLCRHVETISDLLLSKLVSLCSNISSFSLKHRLHLPFTGLNPGCCLMTRHAILYVPPWFLILHTSFDRVDSDCYCVLLKDFL